MNFNTAGAKASIHIEREGGFRPVTCEGCAAYSILQDALDIKKRATNAARLSKSYPNSDENYAEQARVLEKAWNEAFEAYEMTCQRLCQKGQCQTQNQPKIIFIEIPSRRSTEPMEIPNLLEILPE